MYNCLVQDLLENNAVVRPDAIALVIEGQGYSYLQLNTLANQAAQLFVAAGLQKGQCVVLCLDNSLELIIVMFGALKAGGFFVNLNPEAPIQKLVFYLREMQPAVIVAQGQGPRSETFQQALRQAELGTALFWVGKGNLPTTGANFSQSLAAASDTPLPRTTIDGDLCTVIYTSGSTGTPKGVMLAHRHILAAATSIGAYLGNTAEDVVLCVLPLSFSYGMTLLTTTFMAGGKLVLERGAVFLAKTLALLHSEKVTGFAGVPTLFNDILQQPNLTNLALPHLRYLTCAGGALLPAQYQKLRTTFPQAEIIPMYGQTENARIFYCPTAIADQKPASVGVPVPNLEATIVDEGGQPLTPGELGELVVRSPFMAYGYWNRPEETAAKFRTGKFPGDRLLHTGDLFRQDEDGHFYFVARKDDIIKCRGEKVPPREVENVLMQLNGVREAAVVGLPDERLGQAVAAAVVLREDVQLSDKEVLAHCKRHLESFMLPSKIRFVAAMPKTENGKIRRDDVKKLFE